MPNMVKDKIGDICKQLLCRKYDIYTAMKYNATTCSHSSETLCIGFAKFTEIMFLYKVSKKCYLFVTFSASLNFVFDKLSLNKTSTSTITFNLGEKCSVNLKKLSLKMQQKLKIQQ